MIALAAVLLAAAPLPTGEVAGQYETDQIEVAAGLELQPGGRFRYALDYGAVSERAEGSWTFDGTTVRLTSTPLSPELANGESSDARFTAEPLRLEDGDLLLARYETLFRFRRVQP